MDHARHSQSLHAVVQLLCWACSIGHYQAIEAGFDLILPVPYHFTGLFLLPQLQEASRALLKSSSPSSPSHLAEVFHRVTRQLVVIEQ